MSITLNAKGVSHAKSLIADGKISTGEWGFSGADGDKLLGPDGSDWAAYSSWFLAEDTSATENTKGRWKYPFGKAGEVFTGALKAIEGYATKEGLSSISDAAKSLLADATPDDDKKDDGERTISDADTPEEMEKQDRAHPGPMADPQTDRKPKGERDAADGDPLPGEPGYDPDDDDPDDDDDDDDEPTMRLSRSGMAHARALVKAGKVSHDAFTLDGEDRAAMLGPNGTHTSELQRHHLGTDSTQDDPAKKPAYPFAKNGRAYSRAFRNIARKAAANGHDDIAQAATELMQAAQPPADDADDAPKPRAKKGRADRPQAARSGKLKYRDLPFTATTTAKDGSYFEGYCAVLNNVDEYGTIMARGCFDRDLERFRSEGFLGGLNHNWDEPIGRPSLVRLDDKGLYVGGDVLDTAHGCDVRKLFAGGVIRKLSFGFDVLESQWLDEPDDVMGYWNSVGYKPTPQDVDRARRGVMLFTRLCVYEASPVMVPGNQLADVTAVRSGEDAPEGLTLDRHALAVLDAVGRLCDRHEQLAGLRASQGRSLSREKLAQLRRIADRLDAALAACQPRAAKADVAALRRELLALSARAHRPSPPA